jgi:hypothetical protein
MFRKFICLSLVAVLSGAAALPTLAASKEEKQAAFIEKVRTGVARLGTGTDACVEVKLRDKTKLKGFISEINNDHFVVTDLKSGNATRVAYPDVQRVKGANLSTGAAIAIGAAIGAGVALLALFAIASTFD